MNESQLWETVLLRHFEENRVKNPEQSLSDAYIGAYKRFLEEKWICNLEPNEHNFTEKEYEKIGFDDGPDLTRIPRTRYRYVDSRRKSTTEKKPNRYTIFSSEKRKEGKDFKEISQLWHQLTEEEKNAYNPK